VDARADLDLVRDAAREAGELALGFWRHDPKSWFKDGNSPVSEADLAVDAHLRRRLLEARPGYGWVSEETVSRPAADGGDRFFVVDPIDGTRAFLRGDPTWCVSVAVIAGGRPLAGVLDAPALGEVFAAERDGPATRNGEPLRIEAPPEAGTLRLSMPDGLRRRLEPRHRDSIRFAASVPSLAYRLAMVADGRLDGTLVGAFANDWDIAAADLVLERAGGSLAGLDGARHLYKPVPKRHGVLVAAGTPETLSRLIGWGRDAA